MSPWAVVNVVPVGSSTDAKLPALGSRVGAGLTQHWLHARVSKMIRNECPSDFNTKNTPNVGSRSPAKSIIPFLCKLAMNWAYLVLERIKVGSE